MSADLVVVRFLRSHINGRFNPSCQSDGFAAKVGEPAPTARNVIAWGNAPGERQSEI